MFSVLRDTDAVVLKVSMGATQGKHQVKDLLSVQGNSTYLVQMFIFKKSTNSHF